MSGVFEFQVTWFVMSLVTGGWISSERPKLHVQTGIQVHRDVRCPESLDRRLDSDACQLLVARTTGQAQQGDGWLRKDRRWPITSE